MHETEIECSTEEEVVDYEPSDDEKELDDEKEPNLYLRKKSSNDPERDQIVESTYNTDAWQKRLTGRTPEQIEEEVGISKEELFPSDNKILYIGDPWQKMGKEIDDPNLTIIDYEYGEVASFISEDERFRQNILDSGQKIIKGIKIIQEYQEPDQNELRWLLSFKEIILRANQVSGTVQELTDYPKAAQAWQEVKEFIEESQNQNDPLSKSGLIQFRRDSWYTAVYGQRGFTDLPDWERIVKPKLEKVEKKLKSQDLDDVEIQRQLNLRRKQYIEEVRLQKKPEKAGVVEGIFPELPFQAETFDRLVASWSISTHVFPELTDKGFLVYWQEIYRVLKKGGKAYIFPLYEMDEAMFLKSLENIKNKLKLEYELYDRDGRVENELEYVETLVLIKQDEK